MKALVQDGGAGPGAEALAWADAVRNSVESHWRDFQATQRWTRWLPGRPPAPGDLPPGVLDVLERLSREDPALDSLADLYESAAEEIAGLAAAGGSGTGAAPVAADLRECAAAAAAIARRLASVAHLASELVEQMDFTFLFDSERRLFSIGYSLTEGRLDSGYYDLLASEARLASFIAIARGDVPVGHWFRLGRSVTPVGKGSALVSWSGSMFEYLMPDLVMKAPSGSLLEQTDRLIVERQMRYAAGRGVPWGISESAFNARDLRFTYQYSNFGVSGLGLKRGLSEDLVIAPYATALAAMVDPVASARNFEGWPPPGARRSRVLRSVDYTVARLPEGEKVAVVRAHMAHHQG
jgi:cyclic beta-1,2-glucan synthetase